jgi:hypothetical protein
VGRNIVLAVVAVALALGAGVAYAATQTTASGGTTACVNDTNGLVRVTDACREGEHPLTIGGGGNATATQNGVFSVAADTTGGSKSLPLTGLILSGRCVTIPPESGGGMLARPLLEAASGQTIDVFSLTGIGSVVDGHSALLVPVGFESPFGTKKSSETAVVTSNGATATITFGGYVDHAAGDCKFLWQAVETPN